MTMTKKGKKQMIVCINKFADGTKYVARIDYVYEQTIANEKEIAQNYKKGYDEVHLVAFNEDVLLKHCATKSKQV